jgi:hypothetical protein
MKTLKLLIAAAGLFSAAALSAQNGSISGIVMDEKGEPLPFATVAILDDTSIVTGVSADDQGFYSIKQVLPGNYNIKAYSLSYNTQLIKGVNVNPGKAVKLNVKMELNNTLITVVVESKYKESVLDQEYSTITSITYDQIDNMPASKGDIVGIITAVTPGVMATPDGRDLYVRGSRAGSTAYYVDGNRTMQPAQVPGMGIAGIEVLTGGMPAEYGDCTGGIVVITTKEYKWEEHKKKVRREARDEALQSEETPSTQLIVE